jgi:hypothetical protein
MGKIGFTKGTANKTRVPTKVSNKADGEAWSIPDPALRLIGAVASYMGEPGYYKDSLTVSPSEDYNVNAIDERGRNIVEASIQLAKKSPEDLLIIARWTRESMNMRLSPQIMLAVAAKFIKGGNPNPVTRYVPYICSRADDLLQAQALYLSLFGKPSKNGRYMRARLPKPFQKGLASALSKQSDKQIIKYNQTGTYPNFGTLLRTMRHVQIPAGREKGTWPVSRGMHKYLLTGEITEDAPAILSARKAFFALDKKNANLDDAWELVHAAGLTWEDLVSHFGGTSDKARLSKIWGMAKGTMGYMAKLRNLRNFMQKAPESVVKKVSDELATRDAVLKSKQLPYRFLSAHKAVEGAPGSPALCRYVSDNIAEALDHSIENLPEFSGPTAVFVDTSGSMDNSVSEKSMVSMKDAAAVLGALMYKKTKGSVIRPFTGGCLGHGWDISASRRDSAMTIAQSVINHRPPNHGTDASSAIEYLVKNQVKVDRIVVLSDLQTYNYGGGYGWGYSEQGSYGGSVEKAITDYRKRINPNCFLFTVNMAAYESSMVPQDNPLNVQIGGFSEKLISLFINHENEITGKTQKQAAVPVKERHVPTVAELRAQFTVPKVQA